MALKLKRAPSDRDIHSVDYSGIAAGDVVATDKTKVSAVTDRPLGIVLDDVASNNPDKLKDVYGNGTIYEDTTWSGGNQGDLIYSDGGGTVSTTEPGGGAGSLVWVFGTIREADTVSSGTGAEIEVDIQVYERGA